MRDQLELPDVSIVALGYDRWGAGVFGKLIGDWALTIWDPRYRNLILARDFIGARRLYYFSNTEAVLWGSLLEDLVRASKSPLCLDERYFAGWLESFPDASLTPYSTIRAVPPASFVRFSNEHGSTQRYWRLEDISEVTLRSDKEYEEQFRVRLQQAVRRRISFSTPGLAELSGGMDSTAIVCVSDLLASKEGCAPVNTISYFNSNEPHWDELPYINAVERQRNRAGLHIDVGDWSSEDSLSSIFRSWPGSRAGTDPSPMMKWMREQNGRTLLSGLGGDEVLGGVPAAFPELEDLFAAARVTELLKRAMAWARVQRRPCVHLLGKTMMAFAPSWMFAADRAADRLPWLSRDFAHRNSEVFRSQKLSLIGCRPSVQEGARALESLSKQISATERPNEHPFEKTYPLLDRNLVEFLFATPREQIVRPGERRSLMRRALEGIVPGEVLQRRRKAYVSRSPIMRIKERSQALQEGNLLLDSLGVVDRPKLLGSVEAICCGRPGYVVPVLRALLLEKWLRALHASGVLVGRTVYPPAQDSSDAASFTRKDDVGIAKESIV